MQTELRLMDKDAIPQMVKLEKLCFPDPWSPRAFRGELKNPLAVYYTAVDGEEILGYAGMHDVAGEGQITNIAVSPVHRRKGIASLLLRALIEYAETHSLELLTLEVRVSNEAAIALYESFGFERMGVRPHYYNRPLEGALIMTKFFRKT